MSSLHWAKIPKIPLLGVSKDTYIPHALQKIKGSHSLLTPGVQGILGFACAVSFLNPPCTPALLVQVHEVWCCPTTLLQVVCIDSSSFCSWINRSEAYCGSLPCLMWPPCPPTSKDEQWGHCWVLHPEKTLENFLVRVGSMWSPGAPDDHS